MRPHPIASLAGADFVAIIAVLSEVDVSFTMAVQTRWLFLVFLVSPALACFIVRRLGAIDAPEPAA